MNLNDTKQSGFTNSKNQLNEINTSPISKFQWWIHKMVYTLDCASENNSCFGPWEQPKTVLTSSL